MLKYVTFRNEELEEKAKVMIGEDTELLDNETYERSEATANK